MKKEIRQFAKRLIPDSIHPFLRVSSIKNILLERRIRKRYLFEKKQGFKRGISTRKDPDIIISLTSFGSRLNQVYLTVYTLLSQDLKPSKIILWISEADSPKLGSLSKNLLALRKKGLEIRYVKENLRSYKKLIYSLEEFPKSIIVTADDDVLYPSWWLKKLYSVHLENPTEVICFRGHYIPKGQNKKQIPYNSWPEVTLSKGFSSFNILPTGCSGVLYPKNSLDKEVFNKKVFLNICPHADDIWFKAMSLKKKIKCRRVYGKNIDFPSIISSQKNSLTKINVGESKNDIQLNSVFNKYGLFKFLDKR